MGPPDDTEEQLAPLVAAGRIRYLRQPNAGMAAARNAGAAIATSPYVYFLDDDDLLFPGALAVLLEDLETHPDAGMVCGELITFSGEPPPAPELFFETWTIDRDAFLRFNQIGSPGQVIIRRSTFEELGGFDRTIWGTDDWDLWLRLLDRAPGRWVRTPVLAYRLHSSNFSRNVARMYQSSLRVARRHISRLPPHARTLARYSTYRALRAYHVPRLKEMFVATAQSRRVATGARRSSCVGYCMGNGCLRDRPPEDPPGRSRAVAPPARRRFG